MKFAVLGDSPALAPLLNAFGSQDEHAVIAAARLQASAPAFLERFPSARVSHDDHDFLELSAETICVIAGCDETTQEMARRLATEGHPLLVLPDYSHGVSFVYELTLIRDDSGALLIPAFPLRWHRLMQSLRAVLEQQTLGPLLHIEFEREFSNGAVFSRRHYQSAFFQDVDLIREIGGSYNQITALETGSEDRLSQALVTLAGAGLPDCIWKCSGGQQDRWRLAVSGTEGVVSLNGWDRSGETDLSLNFERADDSVRERLLAVFEGRQLEATDARCDGFRNWLGSDDPLGASQWDLLTQAFEITDATATSLRRRRTIDLHFDTASELSQFKTYMTATGCGVLLFTLLGLVVYLIVGNLFVLPPGVLHVLRILWILPLAVFLLLQLLVMVARPSSSGREA